MSRIFIYSLNDPVTNEIRYVGKSDNPELRFSAHLSLSRHKPISKVHRWIHELLLKGTKPNMGILEECSESTWEKREKRLINHYRNSGCDLLNMQDGGKKISEAEAVGRLLLLSKEEAVGLILSARHLTADGWRRVLMRGTASMRRP